MSDETYSFSTAKSRLEEIVVQVRKKDTSLEKSLDLLEEGVRLANACTELIDHADWTAGNAPVSEADESQSGNAAVAAASDAEFVDGSPAAADAVAAAEAEDAEFAPDDDAFGDAADETWADRTPDFADEEADDNTDGEPAITDGAPDEGE